MLWTSQEVSHQLFDNEPVGGVIGSKLAATTVEKLQHDDAEAAGEVQRKYVQKWRSFVEAFTDITRYLNAGF